MFELTMNPVMVGSAHLSGKKAIRVEDGWKWLTLLLPPFSSLQFDASRPAGIL